MGSLTGIYIGQLQHLRGKRALLRRPPEGGFILAQFDDRGLTLSGAAVQTTAMQDEPHCRFQTLQPLDEPPPDALGYGWHIFRINEFDITKDES